MIKLQGADSNSGTLSNPFLNLFSDTSKLVASDDDSGAGKDAQIGFFATLRPTTSTPGRSATRPPTIHVLAPRSLALRARMSWPEQAITDLIMAATATTSLAVFEGSDILRED
ncbi:MAG: hypothetical protein R3D01_11965 [Hyphomicrobiales bacterium]